MAQAGTAYLDIEARTDDMQSAILDALSSIDSTVAIEADTGAVSDDVSAAVADADTTAVVEADATAVADDVSAAVAEADTTAVIDADTSEAQSEIDAIDGGSVVTTVTADTSQAQEGINDLSGSVEGLLGTLGGGGGGGGAVGALGDFAGALGVGSVGVAGLTAGLGAAAYAASEVLQSFGEAQVVAAETNSMLGSLGDGAVTSSAHISELSQSIMEYSGFSDEAVQSGANTLLMFDNINSQPVFDRALNDAADLARRLGTDVPTAARMLGMALQDPEAGMNRLRRAGIVLTESQKATVEAMMETGDVAGAQEVIFDALEGRIGNVAEDYGETLPGQMDKANESIDEMKESFGQLLAPMAAFGASAAADVADGINAITVSAGGWLHGAAVDLGQWIGVVDESAGAADGAARSFVDLGAVSSDALFTGGHASQFMADRLGDTEGEASDAERAISDLAQAIDDYVNGIVSVPAAQRDLRQSFADLAEANVSGTWNDQAEAMEDVIVNTANLVQTQNDLGFSTEQMNATIYGAIGILNAAHDAGQITDDQFARLSAQIQGIPIPDPITTTTNAPDTEAQVKTLGDTIEKTPTAWSTRFTDNAPETSGRIGGVVAAIRNIDRNVDINLRVNTGSLYADVAGAAAALRSLRGPESTLGPSDARQSVTAATSGLAGLAVDVPTGTTAGGRGNRTSPGGQPLQVVLDRRVIGEVMVPILADADRELR